MPWSEQRWHLCLLRHSWRVRGGGCSADRHNVLRLPCLPLEQSEDPPISSFPSSSGPVVSLINVRLQSWQGALASDARSLQSPNWLGRSQAVGCFFCRINSWWAEFMTLTLLTVALRENCSQEAVLSGAQAFREVHSGETVIPNTKRKKEWAKLTIFVLQIS